TDPSAKSLYEYGTLPGVVNLSRLGALPIKNYTTNVSPVDMSQWEAPKLREGFDHRGHQCSACGMHHCHMSVIRQGERKGTIVDDRALALALPDDRHVAVVHAAGAALMAAMVEALAQLRGLPLTHVDRRDIGRVILDRQGPQP